MEQNIVLVSQNIMGLDVTYRRNSRDEKILGHSFENDIFYREIPFFRISKNPVIIDVGAHIGTFSLLSSIKYPFAKVFCFEASKDTYSILLHNVKFNNLHNIVPLHLALCGENKRVKLYHDVEGGNWGHSITKDLSNSYEEVEGVSLSAFIENNQFSFIDLIKFNCEGAEFEIVLNTPIRDLQRVGCLIILYHADLIDNSAGDHKEKLIKHLIDSGFRIKDVFPSKNRGWLIATNKKEYTEFNMFVSRLIRKFNNLFAR